MRTRSLRDATSLACLACLLISQPAPAYSVLSHEAVVDAMWDVKIKPVLLRQFPNATPDDLKTAHAFAYGGAIIQDLGYYPHGSQEFSDLTHYVRTGDFIVALIQESRDVKELAFALGALSHYVSDLDGHRYATNIGEPMLYPKLRKKYGDYITFEDNPIGHLQTEFGFDVLEVARGNFAPQAYHDFIGFDVASGVLQRGFRDTYGLDLTDVFSDFDLAINSYRHAVSKTIPNATRVAWAQKQDQIRHSEPGITRKHFVYTMSRASFERQWGTQYDRPSAGDRILAFFLKLLPRIGPLKALSFKMPTPQVENLFMQSFDRSTAQYRETLQASSEGKLRLEDRNYDVGVITAAGTYFLEDRVQAYWLSKLADKNFQTVTPAIAAELLDYYHDLDAPIDTRKDKKKWAQLKQQLAQLRTATAMAAGPQPAASAMPNSK